MSLDQCHSTVGELAVPKARSVTNEQIGQGLSRLRREEARVRVGKFRRLPRHGVKHARMLMAEAGHRRATGCVQNFAAVGAHEPDAMAGDCGGWCSMQAAMQDTALGARTRLHFCVRLHAHGDLPFSATYCDVAASRASVSRRRLLARTPPKTKVAAASDCAMATAPVRLGKNPGERAASNRSR